MHAALGLWVRSVVLCALGTIMTGCALGQLVMDYRWAPSSHEHPAQLLRVRGEKDPAFELQLVIRYETSHHACARKINWIAGITEPRSRETRYVLPANRPSYEVTIPLDQYIPGPCQWRPRKVTYSVSKANSSHRVSSVQPTLVGFGFRNTPNESHYPTSLPPLEVECFEMKTEQTGRPEFHCSESRQVISPATKELQINVLDRAHIAR
jgi:hypothetical protein